MTERCENCRFFRNFPETQCRFNPPVTFLIPGPQGAILHSNFAGTKAENWCGKWERAITIASES